jgi:glyoxylase-like metal-dependent hydrolase (beta-lactamase superfamily II)
MSSRPQLVTRNELAYPFEAHPAGTTQEIAPGLLWVRMPLPFALDHINLWLIADGSEWTLVDCGLGTDTTRTLWEAILGRDLGGREIGRVIVTHYHPDHIGPRGLDERKVQPRAVDDAG